MANRDTSSVVSIASSDGASDWRSSRNVTPPSESTGSAARQSELIVSDSACALAGCGGVGSTLAVCTVTSISGW